MSVRSTSDTVRIASRIGNAIRHASVSAAPVQKKRGEMRKEHGSHIYVYSHLQTKQVVYSLTPAVNNNHALRQLPYNGKKTVPRALRKDLWHPMATISFSPTIPNAPELGLSTFQKLREYRKLHELLWPKEEMQGLSRVKRGRKLMDQKANSVADMAAALTKVFGEGVTPGKSASKGEQEENKSVAVAAPEEVQATIRWTDILDAEFAESWPKAVVHDLWEAGRNNRRTMVEDDFVQEERTAAAEPVIPEDVRKDETGKIVL